MRPTAVIPLVLVAAAALVYANGLAAPFLFDDHDAIVENPHVRSLRPLSYALSAPHQSTVAGRPLVSLSLAANYAVGGLDPRGYRAFNVAVHAVCALLLFGIVRRTLTTGARSERLAADATTFAGCVALLWTVHPLGSETVNYVVQRTESIMAMFYLLALYAAIRAWSSPRRGLWTAAAIAACALGMTAKETMVTAPVAIALYDAAYRSGAWSETLRRRRALYAGLAACWVVLAGLMIGGPRSETVGLGLGTSAVDYLKNQCVVVLDYLRHAFWPHPLVIDYGYTRPLPAGEATLPAFLLIVLAIATVWTFLRRPTAGYPALWVFVVLAPTSSFVPIVSEVGAERRMYLPLAGVVVLVVLAGYRAMQLVRGRHPRLAGVAAGTSALLVAAALAWATHARNEDYLTEVSIWQSGVAARPDNPRAHNNLGRAYHVQGDLEQAQQRYRRALELDTDYAEAHYNLGVAFADLGRRDEAIERYRLALRLNPALPRAHHNLGSELAGRGELDAALPHFRDAVRLAPDMAHARHSLARALRLSGQARASLEHYREAIRMSPEWPTPKSDLAWILATHPDESLREPNEALRLASEAVRLSGREDPTLLDTLAAAHASNGSYDLAVATAERAMRSAAGAGHEAFADEIRGRLEGYARKEPYREP